MGESRLTFADRSRPRRAVVAGLGGLWALVLLPFPATEFGLPWWTWVFHYRAYFWTLEAVHEWWEPLLSLVILMATCVVAILVAARIYQNSLLRKGGRVKLSEAIGR
ncbi:hypothetical protein ACFFIR_10680 [Microbacterium arthrosphaerae]|uniref:hypothetical protein n=1 Tax=Microbacterium TaxID=33882 RepID=UPI0035EF34E0